MMPVAAAARQTTAGGAGSGARTCLPPPDATRDWDLPTCLIVANCHPAERSAAGGEAGGAAAALAAARRRAGHQLWRQEQRGAAVPLRRAVMPLACVAFTISVRIMLQPLAKPAAQSCLSRGKTSPCIIAKSGLFAHIAGFVQEGNPCDQLMLSCPLPPVAEWTEAMHACLALLQVHLAVYLD